MSENRESFLVLKKSAFRSRSIIKVMGRDRRRIESRKKILLENIFFESFLLDLSRNCRIDAHDRSPLRQLTSSSLESPLIIHFYLSKTLKSKEIII